MHGRLLGGAVLEEIRKASRSLQPMRSNQLQERLSRDFPTFSRSEIDMRSRQLRATIDDGALSVGKRGGAQPHLRPYEAALHVLALVAPAVDQVPEVVERVLEKCRFVALPAAKHKNSSLADAKAVNERVPYDTLGDALKACAGGQAGETGCPDLWWGNIEIAETGDLGWIWVQDDRSGLMKMLFAADRPRVLGEMEAAAERAANLKHPALSSADHALMLRRRAYAGFDKSHRGRRFVLSAEYLHSLGGDVFISNPANEAEQS
ncbi:MAG: hypothetical protein ABIQ30_07465 [Devosia sp.]